MKRYAAGVAVTFAVAADARSEFVPPNKKYVARVVAAFYVSWRGAKAEAAAVEVEVEVPVQKDNSPRPPPQNPLLPPTHIACTGAWPMQHSKYSYK